MSPRRRVEAQERDFFEVEPVEPKPPRRWGLPVVAGLAAVLIAAAVGASTFMLVRHEMDRRTELRTAAALDYVRSFMTDYTSLDPFNANAYADRIQSKGTGEFAKMFSERKNEILLQVARAEPTKGTVLEAGVQRWSDNGSAEVLVATKVTTKTPDGKSTIESGNRWIATATKEGQQWKISNLIQVI
ncbi:mammalian cell entry protein [Mycobacterium hubeiense]|uniref:mammalian cell entry protein n=1 Tax=Mycobacterium hubeiense TaxID=1867256 RepID=UPI000C7F460E|nr:mammalian cell entry protein [Mycobacterium sp. QGD 101]